MIPKIAYLLFDGTISAAIVSLGAVSYASHRKSRLNVIFAFFSLSVAFWIIVNYFSNDTGLSSNDALVANYLVFFAPLLALLLLYLFVIEVTNVKLHKATHSIVLASVFGLTIADAVGLIVSSVAVQGEVYGVEFGPLAPVYFATVIILIGLALYILHKAVHEKSIRNVHQRAQLVILQRSVAIGITLILLTNFVAPAIFGQFFWTQFGTVGILILIGALLYSMVRHNLFDIRLVAVRTVAYIMSVTTIAIVYFALAYLISISLFHNRVTSGLSVSPINIALALVLAFIFQPIKRFFDRWTNQIFYRDQYDPSTFVEQLGQILTSTIQLQSVLERSLDKITRTLKSNGGLFVVYREGRDDMFVGQAKLNHFTDEEYALLRRVVELRGTKIMQVDVEVRYRDTELARLHRLLKKRQVAIVLPLVSVDETVGYLLLGEQMSNGYSKRDVSTIEMISNELVIAIMNARSVQVVRDLNTHLEERVDQATQELQRTNKRLVELDETKDEFLSMASHQLRTPLTSVKGYISMVLEGDAGEISAAQKQLLGEAFTSSERMVNLIADFLNVSRLQTGKFVIERTRCDLAKVVEQEVESVQQIAKSHSLELVCRVSKVHPVLYIDEGKIRQVIMNFIDNAIYYSPDSKVVKVTMTVEDGDVVVRVVDHGIGVPKEVQKKLFTKFFRAENARKQRPDGTGIGLYLARRVIDGHHGKLVFESEEDKGSTFGFRLPIKQLSEPPVEKAETAISLK